MRVCVFWSKKRDKTTSERINIITYNTKVIILIYNHIGCGGKESDMAAAEDTNIDDAIRHDRPISKQNPIVFFDISIGGTEVGRIKMELFADVVPKTTENFRQLHRGNRRSENEGTAGV